MTTLSATTLILMLTLPVLGAALAAPTESAPDADTLTVTGTAANARAGAMVVSDSGATWLVGGLEGWPDGVDGRRVRVTGRAVQARAFPEATVDADGLHTAGVAPGSALDTVLHEPTWSVLDGTDGLQPAPWRIAISDGSGNLTSLWWTDADAPIAWSTDPVTPAESSSGTYSGGEPESGTLSEAQAAALWTRLRALETDRSQHAATRAKGTGAVSLITPAGQRDFLLSGPALAGVKALLPD